MARGMTILVACVLTAAVVCGCREWKQQARTFDKQRVNAGALIGSDMAAVEKALGKPSFKADRGGKEMVWTYSFTDCTLDTPTSVGFEKPETFAGKTVACESRVMRLYFKDGKLEAIQGN